MPLADDFWDNIYRLTGQPTRVEEYKFHVYNNYLTRWVDFITETYGDEDGLFSSVMNSASKLQRNTEIDVNYLKRFLTIGWNTEYLLSYNDESNNTDILRINNQWKPIQAYYSVYSIAECVVFCLLNKKTENHQACLRDMSNLLTGNGKLKDLKPWSLAFTGAKGNKKMPRSIKPINFPAGITIPNALKVNEVSAIESLACCLHAEHMNRIEEWTRPKGGPWKYQHDPKATTIFHFLYRLRIKSNYKDADLFMVDAPPEKIRDFSTNLTKIVGYTNLVLETIIMRKIGRKQMLELIQEFTKKNTNATIRNRAKLYIAS